MCVCVYIYIYIYIPKCLYVVQSIYTYIRTYIHTHICQVITRTLGAVSSLVTLIVLFILIFAILGMSVFGGAAVGSLDEEDADGLSYFRPRCFLRVIMPGDPAVKTFRLISYNTSHVGGNGTKEWPFVYSPYQVSIYVCMYMFAYKVCVCTLPQTYIHICMHTYIHAYIPPQSVNLSEHHSISNSLCVCVCVYVRLCIHIRIHILCI